MRTCCIFDLDGTLTQTLESLARPCNRTLRHFGLPPMPVDNYRYYVGDGLDNALRRALRDAGDPEGRFFREGIQLCRAWFAEDPLYHVTPCEGIPALLRTLRERGVRLGVCTNKIHAQAISVVEEIFGPGTFDAIQGQTEEIPIKPDPAGVQALLRRMGKAPADCLYIGDSNTDMYTGQNAGLTTVGVTWGFRPRAELAACNPAYIIDRPEELLALLER